MTEEDPGRRLVSWLRAQQLDVLTDTVAELSARVGEVETQVADIDSDTEQFEQRIDDRLDTVTGEVAALVEEVRNLRADVERLEWRP